MNNSPGLSQTFYLVFQNGKKNRYKEDELLLYVDKEAELMNKIMECDFANAESFQKYAYYRLFSESQDGNLYSYQGNKIIFNPFQYKPLLKFLEPGSDERLMVADEVGVGKTIESGIIIDELISRGDIKHNDAIIIVCPSVLCTKWRNELKNKFQIDDFYVHDGKSLSFLLNEIKETGKIHYTHSIVSEQLFRGEKYQQLLKECLEERGEAFFSLLIVDECHHYRNPGTNTNKFGSLLSLCSERVVMLSATPFNLRSDDFYNQLHMLNPTLFPDQTVFNQLLRQIRYVNKSITLVKKDDIESRKQLISHINSLRPIAEQNQYISSDFMRIYEKILSREQLTTKDKVDFEKILEKLNPISSSFTRTLKRDAIEHRVTRETMTLEVHFTNEEATVYNSFLETRQTREEFDEARYELVNDKGFRDEFEVDIKKSRISPRESLLFTYSFLKKENGCSLKIVSETSGIIHVSKDICERIRSYVKRMNLGKRGEELQALVDNGGDLLIDFDGDAAYINKEAVFFKPAGAWIHFAIDYLRALNAEDYENLFYATLKEKDVEELEKGRFWLFSYEMEFDGFFDTKSYEYIVCREDTTKLIVLDETQKKQLLQSVRVSKRPDRVVWDFFDEARMKVEDLAEERKEEIAQNAISGNAIKIGSRIEALRNLSNYRVRNLENELIGAVGKDEERIRRAINRERAKTDEKIRILEEKLNYVGTYALDAICLLDVV